jgi:hypothetical protein
MRFRFTIRDLLWLMLVAALAVAWWLEAFSFFALAMAASLPLSFVVGSRARGRFRVKMTVACLFAVGWIGLAISGRRFAAGTRGTVRAAFFATF